MLKVHDMTSWLGDVTYDDVIPDVWERRKWMEDGHRLSCNSRGSCPCLHTHTHATQWLTTVYPSVLRQFVMCFHTRTFASYLTWLWQACRGLAFLWPRLHWPRLSTPDWQQCQQSRDWQEASASWAGEEAMIGWRGLMTSRAGGGAGREKGRRERSAAGALGMASSSRDSTAPESPGYQPGVHCCSSYQCVQVWHWMRSLMMREMKSQLRMRRV